MAGRITIPNLRVKVPYGSHMPVLINVIMKTNGPVLELGGGFFSTPFLHWICRHMRRSLLTCDDNEKWLESLAAFTSDLHTFKYVDDWNTFDFSAPWNVVFVDQKPPKSRGIVLPKLVHTDYVVIHDTEDRHLDKYGYTEEMMTNLYRYKFRYKRAYPYTSVFSNKYPVRELFK